MYLCGTAVPDVGMGGTRPGEKNGTIPSPLGVKTSAPGNSVGSYAAGNADIEPIRSIGRCP
jgi:hypothetical protein